MLRELFIGLSTSGALRAFAERSSIGQKMSRRFVAGTTVEELLAATAAVNVKGMTVSVDNLGENVSNAAEAEASAQLYHRLPEGLVGIRWSATWTSSGRLEETQGQSQDFMSRMTCGMQPLDS